MRYAAAGAIVLAFTLGAVAEAPAFQPDGPFLAHQERNAAAWATEDADIDARLAALQNRFGQRPNIIYILADDVGWGELGWQGGGKHRGTPTPVLDQMAEEGMRFWSAYAEPSCTPSRIAIMTGRHPVRTGLLSVLWPGMPDGLSPEEVTIAEILSDTGYHTAMWGKWHLGELPQHGPEKQGFDYAFYAAFNGAPDYWQASFEDPSGTLPFADFPGEEAYKDLTGIDLSVSGYIGRKGEERIPIEGPAGLMRPGRQEAFENESSDQMLAWIEDKAATDDPFFIYWATNAVQIAPAAEYADAPGVDRSNRQASMMLMHNEHVRRLLEKLQELQIAENTLVVWISDNGPMYAMWPTAGYSWLRGGKGEVLEGGVRVPAMAWWPGMIEPGQDPEDMLHLTDLFTTAARLAGATGGIPSDRVTDGIDQLSLLLNGEGHSRRNYMAHYSGDVLGAIRYEDFKVHIRPPQGGLPAMEFYNVRRDPGEKFGDFYPGLWAVTPVQHFMRIHLGMIQEFPHRPPEAPGLTPHD